MDKQEIFSVFVDIVETINGLLDRKESLGEILDWAITYFSHMYHTDMADIVKFICQEIAKERDN